mmetsp:Transcript_29394/g.80341  ORF Transcript_29394/g.80341 Transcript_29394/m.80341 type:complete len:208 (-) Transcript_29394:99-722(-)
MADVDDDGYDGLEFYRALANDELQVEVLPMPGDDQGTRKRPHDEVDADEGLGDAPQAAGEENDEDSEQEDCVRVLLCDQQGPSSGGIAYYLGREWDRGNAGTAAGAIVPSSGEAQTTDSLRRQHSTAEVVAKDEDIEAILSQILFLMDTQEMADTSWRQLGANLQDYFNFDLSEREFKDIVRKQVQIRLEAMRRRKITSADGRSLGG